MQKKISEIDFMRLSKKIKPEMRDIIFPRYGTIGINRLVETDVQFLASYSCAVIKTLKTLSYPKYIFIYSISPLAKLEIEKHVVTTTQPNVGIKSINEFLIPVPPLEEQCRIVVKVQQLQQQLSQLESQVQQSRLYAQHLLQTVLKEAFTQKQNFDVVEELNIAAEPFINYSTLQSRDHLPAELHAMLLTKIIDGHEQQPKYLPTLGRVKGEKNCHIIENQLDLDLGREPLKDAAGPVDFRHVLEVEKMAHKRQWFEAKQKKTKGKVDYIKGPQFSEALKQASDAFKGREERIERIINLFLPLDTEQTEIIATAYAAWNNLLLVQVSFTDEDIITEARENWTKEKLRYFRPEFQRAIDWLRTNQLVPAGKGKLVHPK